MTEVRIAAAPRNGMEGYVGRGTARLADKPHDFGKLPQ